MHLPTPQRLVILTFAVSIAGCSSSSSSPNTSAPPTPTYSATVSAATLSLTAIAGLGAATGSVTLTNTGTGTLSFTAISPSGANASLFGTATSTSPCGTTLAAGASCIMPITFATAGSGTFTATLTFADNATAGNQTVALTGIGIASATAANTVDCSVNSATCADTFTAAFTTAGSQLATDPFATGGFHGYADPSLRKDPNSAAFYYAYSWAHLLADGTPVVDLHLAQSTNAGQSFTYVGPLYRSAQSTQTGSTAYSAINNSSTEVVDLLPIPLTGTGAGQTLWVQAHQSYLVKPTGAIYDQLNVTGIISVTAVQLTAAQEASPAVAATAMLGLSTAPEARLGANDTDLTRGVTQNIAALSSSMSKCGNLGQPALWYQAPTLYLALECTEISGNGNIDANELAHFLFATTPTGADASQWTWGYVTEFATGAQAAKLGATTAEGNTTYAFFTEPEFVATKSGPLAIILTPGVFNTSPTATQPVIQYGCRIVPVTSLSTSGITLDTDATTSALVVTAKVTENDLYTGANEGPAACTYDPNASTGIVMGRKFESDPTYGFYIYPVNSGILP